MATETVDTRLSYDERVQARQAGVNAAITEQLGANTQKLDILTARNIQNITRKGVFGFMEVTVEWTEPDGKWHWHSLRFNGERDIAMSEEHLAVLGQFACARPTDVKDYTIGVFASAHEPETKTANILPMPEMGPELTPVHIDTAADETVAA